MSLLHLRATGQLHVKNPTRLVNDFHSGYGIKVGKQKSYKSRFFGTFNNYNVHFTATLNDNRFAVFLHYFNNETHHNQAKL